MNGQRRFGKIMNFKLLTNEIVTIEPNDNFIFIDMED